MTQIGDTEEDEVVPASAPEPSTQPTQAGPAPDLWRNRDFRLLVGGQSAGTIGGAIAVFVFPVLAATSTGSVWQTALVSAAMPLGGVLLGAHGGQVADRYDKRRILQLVAIGTTLVYASLVAVSLAGALGVVHLAVAAFAIGARGAYFAPAEQSAVRHLVATDELASAQTSLQARSAIASLVGAPVGGALLAVNPALPFAVGAASYLVVLFVISRIQADLHGAGRGAAKGHALDGFRWTGRNPDVLVVMVAAAVLNFAFAALLFMVVVSLALDGTPAAQIGFVETAAAAGGLLGAFLAGRVVPRVRTGVLVLTTFAVVCAGAFGLAAAQVLWQFLLMLALVEMVSPATNSGLVGFLLARAPDHLQGRVVAALQILATAVVPFAPLVAGQLMGSMGYQAAATCIAGLTVLALSLLLLNRSIRGIPRPDDWATYLRRLGADDSDE